MKRILGLFLLFASFSLLFFVLYGQHSSQSIQEEMKKVIKTKQSQVQPELSAIQEKVTIPMEEEDKIMEAFDDEKEQDTELSKIEQENERKRVIENALAILAIPSIDLEVAVSEGVSDGNLKYSVAHYANSAAFGEIGNACVLGHRTHSYNRFFYKLDKVKKGDTIDIDTGDRKITYKVYDIFIVEPKDIWVLNPTDNSELTLITCTPVRVSTHRLIIKAHLLEEK